MTKTEILNIINKTPIFYLATVKDNKPHVRAMSLLNMIEDKILFGTDIHKDVYKELINNQQIELCFFNSKENLQIRVTGKATPLHKEELKKEVVKSRPFLKPLIQKDGYDAIVIYCLTDAKATVWSMETSYEAKNYIYL
ncbi:pyridoxamine 5'-phosphate oxidase family protein [Puteibacter caeruleilacunae]|nr:pyridoxamine 5'-phosphate oxidase family protein [Puteibacter caeruleilacunae]